MPTSTEFITFISAPTLSTSFAFRDLVKEGFKDVHRFMSTDSSDHNVLWAWVALGAFLLDCSQSPIFP